MRPRWPRVVALGLSALLALAAVTYVAGGAALWWTQDRFLFPAPGGIGRDSLDAAAAEVGAVPLALVSEDGTELYAWYLRGDGSRLVLFFHGNGETVSDYVPLYRILQAAGWDVMVPAWRGYPGSGGSPSEAGLAMDGRAAWAWAIGPGGYPPDRIVVHGRSLGGGVAAIVVEGDANPAALVLESTFASVRELAGRAVWMYPTDLLLRHPFDTRARASKLGVPVLVLHSRSDQFIPIEHGGPDLAASIAEVEVHLADPWRHEDCLPVVDPALREAWLAFLERTVPRR